MKTLAIVSPVPPQKTGIAFYTRDLLPYLSKYYRITLVSDETPIDPIISGYADFMHYKEFLEYAYRFDRVLYHFGNSKYHGYMIGLLEAVPGVVLLHEVFLPDLIYYLTLYEKPGYIYEEAYYSHGWRGLIEISKDIERKDNFPFCKRILDLSVGIIVHNSYAINLLKKFFPVFESKKFRVVPHFAIPQEINYSSEKALLCSLGFIAKHKLHDRIAEAIRLTRAVKEIPEFRVLFVGEPVDEFGEKLLDLILKEGLEEKIKITGFVSENEFTNYLKKCTAVIQLRLNSKGETSGALLKALSYGKPVIVNSHGFFRELPEDAVFKISEDPSPEEIASAIDSLIFSENKRKSLSKGAIEFVKNHLSPDKIARSIFETVEEFYKAFPINRFTYFVAKDVADLELASKLLSFNIISKAKEKQLLFDVSGISYEDLKTGIQRVVKAELKHLIKHPPEGYRVEPVRMIPENNMWRLSYAFQFSKEFFKVNTLNLNDTYVCPEEGDIYYIPDYFPIGVAKAEELFKHLKLRGVKIVFLLYDLLPLEFPNYFPKGTKEFHEKYLVNIANFSDMVICISKTTAKKFESFVEKNNLRKPKIKVLYLGSDFRSAKHKESLTEEEKKVLNLIKERKFFLMVSTIEPRKGHMQVIKAFELLWKEGYDFQLVLVGRKGWMVEDVIRYIERHPLKNFKLFWLKQASDECLEILYKNALATIIASEGEGFGLPIIEAAQYGTPIIVRDIEVFREVAKDSAFYFKNSKKPEVLAEAIKEWYGLYKKGEVPKPSKVEIMSWKEHTERLKAILEELETS